jgi:hypothetical protein
MKMHLPVVAGDGGALFNGCAGVLADCLLMHLPVVAEDGTC